MRHITQNPAHYFHPQKCIFGLMLIGGMTVVGGSFLKPMPPALAQTAEPAVPAATEPIAITGAEDAVQKFTAANQLYIKGAPLNPDQIETLQMLLQQHPNIYVVLIDTTSDVLGDDLTLSRGIGNSAAFQSVQNPELNERSGVLFMVYFDSDQGRKIFMRAEALPDKLGVGEANFADPSGNPRELLSLFVNAVQNEGKDVPGALEVVIQRINEAIQQHVQDTVQGTAQTIQQAETGLAELQTAFTAFQAKYGVDGPLGNPNMEAWKQQLEEAKTASSNRQFGEAAALANQILEQIRAQEEAMDSYEQTLAIADSLSETIESIQRDLSTLQSNQHTQTATELTTQALQSLEDYQSQYQSGSLDFGQSLVAAQQQTEQAIAAIAASRELTANRRNLQYLLLALTGLGTGTTGLFTNRRAARRRRQAEQELAEAKAEIGGKAQELIDLMDKVNYATLADYTGKTDQMGQALVEHVTNALTLVGGAEKFLAEAEALIQGHRLTNTFRIVNYEKAIALLTDPETTLTFGLQDSVRTAMTQGSTADSWRQSLLDRDTSRRFEKSLRDVLLAMAENRDSANSLLQEITAKDQKIAQYLTQIEAEATALRPQVQALQDQSQPGHPFRLEAASDVLLPMILDEGGLIARGRALMHHDPVRAWDEFGDLAKRITQDAGAIITVAQATWQNLVPTLNHAHQTLAPHGVETRWADQQQRDLSEVLEDIANLAIRVPITERLQQTQQDVSALEAQIKLVVEQDHARREVCPQLIAAATDDVAQARQDVHDALKQAGAFVEGTVEQVLREPERDPSERIDTAQANLEQIKPCLSEGDTTTAATCLTNIKTLTQEAHDLVHATRQALANYTDVLQERQQRSGAIRASIEAIFQPTLQRIQTAYAAEVLQLVAPEVDAGNTIADNIDLTHNLLQKAQTLSQSAQTQYQQAHLLTARDLLNEADRILKGAQHQLDALTMAEETLRQHQQEAEADLISLTTTMQQLQVSAQANYVRQPALQLVEKATQALSQAQIQVHQQPYHPYASRTCLTATAKVRMEAVQAITADQEAYESAQAALNSAQQIIATAEADVRRAQNTRFTYARVYTGAAEQSLNHARRNRQQAQTRFSDRAYEEAQSLAQQAIPLARAASKTANEAIARARREHDAEVRRIEREAEERRRQAAMASSSSSSFSGGGGSSSSSSGSSGGDWGGGGSGSSGGSW